MSKIIFLDVSTADTGYSVLVNKRITNHGHIKIHGGHAEDRFPGMVKEILKFIISENNPNDPVLVYAEYPFEKMVGDQKNKFNWTGIYFPICIHGSLLFELSKIGISYKNDISPRHWKKNVGLKVDPALKNYKRRKAEKEESVRLANKCVEETVTNDNEADAILMAASYLMDNEYESKN